MARKSKKKKTDYWNEKIRMLTPEGIPVMVPRKKVPVKIKWGWVIADEKKGEEE